MFIPTQDSCLDMSPTDFERFSLYILQQQTKDLEHLEFEHNVIVERSDGSYQIDGIIRFDVMGVTYVTLVECKHYTHAQNRCIYSAAASASKRMPLPSSRMR